VNTSDPDQAFGDYVIRFTVEIRKLCQYLVFGGCQDAVKAPEHRERQNNLAVFVALVGAAEQIADAPDERCNLFM